MPNWSELAAELTESLLLDEAPIAITFGHGAPAGVAAFDGPVAVPAADGRSGRVPAGCVFWTHALTSTFTTEAADHANCSVGSFTHGLIAASDAATKNDVGALVETGWAPAELLDVLPSVGGRPDHVTYGPLADTPVDPDVVLLRLNPKQVMVLNDAVPDMVFEGKPQCHIIPMAKESGMVAASVGCMLSRVRTGMPNSQMTCALPAARLEAVVDAVKATAATDATVAGWAGEDSLRFA